MANLFSHEELIDEIFEKLVKQCYELLPGFGTQLSLDGKAINSHARGKNKASKKDGRRDLETANYLSADRGYDDGKLIIKLWDVHSIKPVIDIRNLWRDGEENKALKEFNNLVYDYRGTVYCCCSHELKLKEMAFAGVEQQRQTLIYRWLVKHY